MAKKNLLDEKRISFLCIEVEEGELLLRCTKNVYHVWSFADESCDLIYQFGVPKRLDHPDYCADMTMDDFKCLVMENYLAGNIQFYI